MTVEEGAGVKPPVGVLVMAGVDDAAEEGRRPLQKPWLQVLKAHCWLLVHEAWKLPQRGCSIEFTA